MKFWLLPSMMAVFFAGITACSATAQDGKDRHVVVVCVDGLPAYLLNDPQVALPSIRGLAARGASAEGMTPANPSVTWPNHTSLMSGVWPARHGVLFNGGLERSGPGLPVKVNPKKEKDELVFAPTLFDVLHEQGYTTAAINWPCTRNMKSVDDNFPDVPDAIDYTTPRLISELQTAGLLVDGTQKSFAKMGSTVRDTVWTYAACQTIRERKPNVMFLHVLNLDGVHHKYGPLTPAGYTAAAYADTLVGEVIQAVDDAGIRDKTTIFVVSDHGFMAIPKTLQPNVLLRKAGLLTVEGNAVTTARVHVVPEGGIAMVYLTMPQDEKGDAAKVIELFKSQEGIADILTPDKFAAFGLPLPTDHPGMANLVLVAKDGYGFSGTATGDDFVIKSEGTLGTHGFLSNNPKMNATFVAAGAGIRAGTKLGQIRNVDLAPTIARLLGSKLDNVDGQVLEQILQPR